MKIKGKITILIDREKTTIELTDETSWVTFARIKLTPDELSSALSRIAYTTCEVEVSGLDKIGKKQEVDKIEFEIPKSLRDSKYSKELSKLAQDVLDLRGGAWIAEGYFASQDSFYEKGGKQYAKCTIRRWI